MKAPLIIAISILLLAPKLSELRELYPKATDDKEITDRLFEKLETVTKDDKAALVAYKGAVHTLKAKFAQGIKDKKEYFKSGKELIEFAIAIEPNDIEIRCLRLGVQENSPKVVKYRADIEADKQFILDHFHAIKSEEIKVFIKNYVLRSSAFDSAEKQLF